MEPHWKRCPSDNHGNHLHHALLVKEACGRRMLIHYHLTSSGSLDFECFNTHQKIFLYKKRLGYTKATFTTLDDQCRRELKETNVEGIHYCVDWETFARDLEERKTPEHETSLYEVIIYSTHATCILGEKQSKMSSLNW